MTIVDKLLLGLWLATLIALGWQTYKRDYAEDFHKEYVAQIQTKLVEAYKENNAQRLVAEKESVRADKEYLRGKNDAEKLANDVAADLRSTNERLQNHWREALRRLDEAQSTAADGRGDGEADALRGDIAEIIQGAAEDDARIMRLQNRIDEYLRQVNGQGYY